MSPNRTFGQRPLWGATSGVAAIEFAVVFPVFLVLVFGLVDFGRLFFTWNTMRLGLEQAGRYAMIYNTCDSGGSCKPNSATYSCSSLATCVQAYAATQMINISPTITTSSSSVTGASGSVSTLVIQAQVTFNFTVPGLLMLVDANASTLSALTLTQTSTVPLI